LNSRNQKSFIQIIIYYKITVSLNYIIKVNEMIIT